MGTHLLITQDGFKVNENDNVSWVINNRYTYELRLCEGHKKLIHSSDGVYKVFKDKLNALKYHDEYLLKNAPIIFESKEEELLYHESEVKRLKEAIEEDNGIKYGDWYFEMSNNVIRRAQNQMTKDYLLSNYNSIKITDQDLINKLNNLIK